MSNETFFYNVAGHIFSVETCGCPLTKMDNYAPFATAPIEAPVFSLTITDSENAPEYNEETRQEDEGQTIICGKTQNGEPTFEFLLGKVSTGLLICSQNFKQNKIHVKNSGSYSEQTSHYAINNALMVLYSLATAKADTALFHAAVIRNNDRGYLFLGKSGTGKSTHARLWLKYNEGSSLLNDDNPVVRLHKNDDGKMFAKVYGSPWSGKTPCYKNEEVDVGGFVLLSQAPYNMIARLKGVAAYAALVPCISGMRWDKEIADGLHRTENGLASSVPVWHLECLPDEAAAKLCKEAIA